MDLSKLPDYQRQELEKLQKQFQEHQAQQQKQQQSVAAAAQHQPPAYDQSQVHQPYDPSQAYHPSYYYNYQNQPQQQSQQQYDPSYYHNYYTNSYQQHHPATLPANDQQRNAEPGSGSVGLGHVRDPYVSTGNQVNLVGTQPNFPVPPGLNPAAAAAAVAALFAGTIGAPMTGGGHFDQGNFRPPVGHGPYRGGGRRGGGPFRGGGRGRGNPGFRPPHTTGGSGPSSHRKGRGRGMGRGPRRGPPFAGTSSNREPSAQGSTDPTSRSSWCDLCKVDCSSPDLLAQHNNGRRHQKNLQMLQCRQAKSSNQPPLQPIVQTENDANANPVSDIGVKDANVNPGSDIDVKDANANPGLDIAVNAGSDIVVNPGSDIGVNPGSDIGPEVPKTDLENEAEKQTIVVDDGNKAETKEVGNQEKRHRMKRKLRAREQVHGGPRRGGKRLRPVSRVRRVVMPLMCDLCNVKCDTQEVFDKHAAGKKHMSKLRSYQRHQAMYGPTAVQALYPPNPLSQTPALQPAYYGASSSYPAPPEAYVPPPYEPQNPNPQLADAPLEFNTQNVVSAGETHAPATELNN